MAASGRRFALVVAAAAVAIAAVAGILVGQGRNVVHQPGGREYCFAEWCVEPKSATIDIQATTVAVQVRSDARQASQRPDHPQAWLIEESGRQIGGPQAALGRLLAPGDSYVTTLVFKTSQPGACPSLIVSEGGWPPFLGLGYAPSPFTTRVEWRVCELVG